MLRPYVLTPFVNKAFRTDFQYFSAKNKVVTEERKPLGHGGSALG
jgi:hypothetical protein